MNSARRKFAIGFTATLVAAVFLNNLPYLWKIIFPLKDSYRILGFPFVFHKQGGLAGVYEFHYWVVVVDTGLALIAAFEIGYLCKRVHRTT